MKTRIAATDPKDILPGNRSMILRPLQMRPSNIKVVIIGPSPPSFRPDTRPDGFAFSGRRIFKDYTATTYISAPQMALYDELINDQAIEPPKHSSLIKWVQQGVMLWNWCPVSQNGTMGIWDKQGFEKLSLEVMESLWLYNGGIVFVPWGVPEMLKSSFLPKDAIIVDTPGPTNRDMFRFANSHPFSKINYALTHYSKVDAINWNINFRT